MTHMMIEDSLLNEIEQARMDTARTIEKNPSMGQKVDETVQNVAQHFDFDRQDLIDYIAILTTGLERGALDG